MSTSSALRLAVAGLSHGHVEWLLDQARWRGDIELTGVYEADDALFDRLTAKYALDPALRRPTLAALLSDAPEAVAGMGPVSEHLVLVAACARAGVHVMVEKPLAYRTADAEAIVAAAAAGGIHVLTNYETTWWPTVRAMREMVVSGELAPVRRMVFRFGHRGPIEVGAGESFLDWLTSADAAGGGALVDFGCYGALLSTWLMSGQAPLAVNAVSASLKPDRYPNCHDDATIVLLYPGVSALVLASWAWTHDVKSIDVHTELGSVEVGAHGLIVREPDGRERHVDPSPMPPWLTDAWTYLRAVVRGECEIDPLTALPQNVAVARILDAALISSR